jgi:hypothetical protein
MINMNFRVPEKEVEKWKKGENTLLKVLVLEPSS